MAPEKTPTAGEDVAGEDVTGEDEEVRDGNLEAVVICWTPGLDQLLDAADQVDGNEFDGPEASSEVSPLG